MVVSTQKDPLDGDAPTENVLIVFDKFIMNKTLVMAIVVIKSAIKRFFIVLFDKFTTSPSNIILQISTKCAYDNITI